MFKNIPTWVKVLLVICFPPLIIFWIGSIFLKPMITYATNENKLFSNLVNNPTKENAKEYIELIRNKPVATFLPDNNPSAWAVLREKWQIINHSNKIPTDMKKEIFEYLVSRGLYVNNSKVINNYKETTANNTFEQDEANRIQNEWAMEEARKSVTPFDHGGYVQGDGFNPSDTMAADAQRQMDNMNQMNQMNNMM